MKKLTNVLSILVLTLIANAYGNKAIGAELKSVLNLKEVTSGVYKEIVSPDSVELNALSDGSLKVFLEITGNTITTYRFYINEKMFATYSMQLKNGNLESDTVKETHLSCESNKKASEVFEDASASEVFLKSSDSKTLNIDGDIFKQASSEELNSLKNSGFSEFCSSKED